MRYILILVLTIFMFLGCSPKQKIISPKQKTKHIVEEEIILEDFFTIETKDMNFKVAIIFPSKIVGKYANSVVNTSLAYLLYRNKQFEMQTFDSYDQSEESIHEVFDEVIKKGYKNIIALYTQDALQDIYSVRDIGTSNVYFPVISKNLINDSNYHFIFGAISYEKQIETLLSLSDGNDSTFYEESSIGIKLKRKYDKYINEPTVDMMVKKRNTNYKKIVNNKNLNDTTLMLHTPIVKTSIILSQLRANNIKPSLVLSSQLNYNPILVSLTQFKDRKKFIVSSSIEETNYELEEFMSIIGSDITYNWVNYSSLIGLNYMFNKNKDLLIKNDIIDNQVEYDVTLYGSTSYGFSKILLD